MPGKELPFLPRVLANVRRGNSVPRFVNNRRLNLPPVGLEAQEGRLHVSVSARIVDSVADANEKHYYPDAMSHLLRVVFISFCLAGAVPIASAAELEMTLVIESHRFVPSELVVPAGSKIKLTVTNRDATAEEFESYELNREKVVAALASVTIWIGPLKPGRYAYFGDYNPKTAQGFIVAR